MIKLTIFENSRWRTAAILKIVSSLYLSRGSSDLNEIWCAAADFGFKDGHVTKYQNIVISKWRTAAILKIVFWQYDPVLLVYRFRVEKSPAEEAEAAASPD